MKATQLPHSTSPYPIPAGFSGLVPTAYNDLDLRDYSKIIVSFSGGKDSLAALLIVVEKLHQMGINPSKVVEVSHQAIDGHGDDKIRYMDWPCTEAYCKAVVKAFGFPYTLAWRAGGFSREMMRENERTAPAHWILPDGTTGEAGGTSGPSITRRKFPQVGAITSGRWCSIKQKIEPHRAMMINRTDIRYAPDEPPYKVLVLSGERAAESANRAAYTPFEPEMGTDLRNGKRYRRWVDRWMPVHGWPESDVWKIIERWRIQPHPAYELGWGRTSCALCIFGSSNQWCSAQKVLPEQFEAVARDEESFGHTIHRTLTVRERAQKGTSYPMKKKWMRIAQSESFPLPIFVADWKLPPGAYGESCGPT